MIYWIFSILTALLACLVGNINPLTIASNFVFHRNLRKLGTGILWASKFRRLFGIRGFIKLGLVEIGIDLLPLAVGAILFGTKGYADVGSSLAGFCLILCRMIPVIGAFDSTDGSIPLLICIPFMNLSVGIMTIIAYALVFFGARYKTPANMFAAIVCFAASIILIDNLLVMRCCYFIAALVFLRNIKPLISLLNSDSEQRIEFKEDLSYKFDEKF